MKRILILTIIFISLSFSNVFAQENIVPDLPNIGEIVSGFEVIEKDEISDYNASAVRFVHQGSGAELIFIQNDDTNLVFSVTFKTPPDSSQGIQHILEHSLLSSSEKYPGNDVFFDMIYKGYLTFINAFTSSNYTMFPISSTSEKQFFAASDAYLDLLFHSSVLSNPNFFYREGIRYELENEDSSLYPVGIVYNEMKQYVNDIEYSAYRKTLENLFPDTPDRFDSAGKPDDILTLTYEQALEYYHNYYAPSKAKMFLYGNVDYRKFLNNINQNYFQNAEKTKQNQEPASQKPFSQLKTATYEHPVGTGSETENQAYIELAYGLPKGISFDEIIGLKLLVNELFNHESFPLLDTLRQRDIAAQFQFFYDSNTLQPALFFQAAYADESKADLLRQTIEEVLQDVVKNGINPELIDSIVSHNALAAKFKPESSTKGLDLIVEMTNTWHILNDPFYGAHQAEHIEKIASKIDEGFFEDLIQKYILQNPHAVLLSAIPRPGLLEEQEAKLQDKLDEKKAAMSQEEIESMVQKTKDFASWDAMEPNPGTIDKIAVLTVDDLPEEINNTQVDEEYIDGVRILSAISPVPDAAGVQIINDVQNINPDTLEYFNFYTALIGRISTENYSQEEISLLSSKYLYNKTFSLSPMSIAYRSDEYRPVFRSGWFYETSQSENAFNSITEMLFRSELTENNLDMIKTIIDEQLSFCDNYKKNGVQYVVQQAQSIFIPSQRFTRFFSGPNLMSFLEKIKKDIESDPKSVLEKIDQSRKTVLNKKNLLVLFAGPEGSKTKFDQDVKAFIANMSDTPLSDEAMKPFDYPSPEKNNGLLANTKVQNIALSASTKDVLPYQAGLSVIEKIISDELLTPEIRFAGGAYGASIHFYLSSMLAFSYNDPNLTNTLEVFSRIPDVLKNSGYTQKELDQHIITAYADYTTPKGEITFVLEGIQNYLLGKTIQDQKNEYMELKSVKLEDFPILGEQLAKAFQASQITVYGFPDTIQEHAELFETITDIR